MHIRRGEEVRSDVLGVARIESRGWGRRGMAPGMALGMTIGGLLEGLAELYTLPSIYISGKEYFTPLYSG